MLTLAQKLYLSSLARKEAAMPWEDDSAAPEILAGLGGAGATAGAVYGPRAYAKLQDKIFDNIFMRASEGKLSPADARMITRGFRRRLANIDDLSKHMPESASKKEKMLFKAMQLLNPSHKAARKYDVALHKLFGKAGIKGKYSKAGAVAALASLVGGGASGIAHLLDD